MAYDPGAIDATLTAAVGDAPTLIAELRLAFVDSAHRALVALEAAGALAATEPGEQAAEADEAWRLAASRLKGLAASFGAVRLMALAEAAGAAPVGDAAVVRKLRRGIDRL